jgi:hypothetical protein
MARTIGATVWAIAEGYIPGASTGAGPALTSHETVCILNAGERDAEVRITAFFADREPVGPFRMAAKARPTRHIKFNDLGEPPAIPRDTGFSSLIEADVPIVVQHSRLDSRQPALALMSTIAFPAA